MIEYRLAAGAVGAGALGAWFLTRRSRRPPGVWPRTFASLPPPVVTGALAVTGSGLALLVLTGQGLNSFAVHEPWGAWAWLTGGIAAAPAFISSGAYLLVELRRRPTL